MINQIYRLVSARQIEVTYKDRAISSDHVVVRPTHLSICAADQRYYTGTRGEEAMKKKITNGIDSRRCRRSSLRPNR